MKELHEGLSGSGHPIWLVATVNKSGWWIWIERFDSKAEALSWIKWA